MEERSYSLREASEISGVALWVIRQGCKNGTIEHQRAGDGTERVHRRLTQKQLDALRASRTVAAKADPGQPPADEIAAVIAATRAATRRPSRRRAA